ncbi:hypothetical protein D3C87_1860430 [compost metagenome]
MNKAYEDVMLRAISDAYDRGFERGKAFGYDEGFLACAKAGTRAEVTGVAADDSGS